LLTRSYRASWLSWKWK